MQLIVSWPWKMDRTVDFCFIHWHPRVLQMVFIKLNRTFQTYYWTVWLKTRRLFCFDTKVQGNYEEHISIPAVCWRRTLFVSTSALMHLPYSFTGFIEWHKWSKCCVKYVTHNIVDVKYLSFLIDFYDLLAIKQLHNYLQCNQSKVKLYRLHFV